MKTAIATDDEQERKQLLLRLLVAMNAILDRYYESEVNGWIITWRRRDQ